MKHSKASELISGCVWNLDAEHNIHARGWNGGGFPTRSPEETERKYFIALSCITFTFVLGRVGLCCNGKLKYVWCLKSVLNIDYQMYQTDRLRVLHRPVTSGFPHESYISESFTQFSVLHVFKLGTIVFHCWLMEIWSWYLDLFFWIPSFLQCEHRGEKCG